MKRENDRECKKAKKKAYLVIEFEALNFNKNI